MKIEEIKKYVIDSVEEMKSWIRYNDKTDKFKAIMVDVIIEDKSIAIFSGRKITVDEALDIDFKDIILNNENYNKELIEEIRFYFDWGDVYIEGGVFYFNY